MKLQAKLLWSGCLALAVLGLGAVPAPAATVLVESLEWVIADADLVVRGTVENVQRVRDKEEVIWSTVTVKVAEAFKGEKPDELKFIASHKSRFASDRLNELGKDKAEVLLCLVKSDRYKTKAADYAEAPWALRQTDGDVDHSFVDLTGKSNQFVVTMDARILSRRDDILKEAATVRTVSAGPKATQGRLRAPATAEVVGKLAPGGGVWIFVPVDARLEEQAKSWLKSKDVGYRAEGVNSLRHFKSDANIALLKPLLDDPDTRTDTRGKTFPARKAAYDVLKEWGVDVKQPVTEEPGN